MAASFFPKQQQQQQQQQQQHWWIFAWNCPVWASEARCCRSFWATLMVWCACRLDAPTVDSTILQQLRPQMLAPKRAEERTISGRCCAEQRKFIHSRGFEPIPWVKGNEALQHRCLCQWWYPGGRLSPEKVAAEHLWLHEKRRVDDAFADTFSPEF